jgi:hypothetical protein
MKWKEKNDNTSLDLIVDITIFIKMPSTYYITSSKSNE